VVTLAWPRITLPGAEGWHAQSEAMGVVNNENGDHEADERRLAITNGFATIEIVEAANQPIRHWNIRHSFVIRH
jgi:hypothetical protein